MRKTIGLMTLLFSLSTLAQVQSIQVEEYLSTDMDFIFEISNKNYEKVVLDCQGFINGVNLYDHHGRHDLLILDIGECEDIHVQIVQGLEKEAPVCLKVDLDRRAYQVTEDYCE